ncbi:deoxynucleoside kinase [Candidatus Dependentiae bacterium]|nr:deoxynucleoside kinase [Candidatus Dependentiae bacterium]
MFIVEANIGAGKTTLLQLIAEHMPHITVAFEPLNAWHRQDAGVSLLEQFYTNPQRWAFSLETFAMACRVIEHLQEQQRNTPYRIAERSIFSGHYCFATNSYATGLMTEVEWRVYLQWFNFLIAHRCAFPHGFIYLQTSPTVAFERIQKRKRSAEEGITLQYLQQIHQAHEDFLVHKKNLLPGLAEVPVLILDANPEFAQDPQQLQQHLAAIESFIEKHANS